MKNLLQTVAKMVATIITIIVFGCICIGFAYKACPETIETCILSILFLFGILTGVAAISNTLSGAKPE